MALLSTRPTQPGLPHLEATLKRTGKGGLNSLLPQAISDTLGNGLMVRYCVPRPVVMIGSWRPESDRPTASGNGSAPASSAECFATWRSHSLAPGRAA